MQVLHICCCGLDVHKRFVVACLITSTADGKQHKELRRFDTMTPELLHLVDWLQEAGCTHVTLEFTGVYWKPLFNLMEGLFEIVLVNAQHMRRSQGARRRSRMPNGSPSCCSMACNEPVLCHLVPSGNCVR